MRFTRTLIALMLLFLVTGGALLAGAFVDVAGQWRLTMRATFPQQGVEGGVDCQFRGSAEVTTDGDSVSGSTFYELVDGADGCPDTFTGDIAATLEGGNTLAGSLTGPLGTGTFEGFLFQPLGDAYFGFSGDFTITQGAFAGTVGSWVGETGSLPPAIPVLGGAGLLALLLLLLGAGFVALRR